jgi:hypothetical protein
MGQMEGRPPYFEEFRRTYFEGVIRMNLISYFVILSTVRAVRQRLKAASLPADTAAEAVPLSKAASKAGQR